MTRSKRGCRRYQRMASMTELPLPPPRTYVIPSSCSSIAAPGKSFANQQTVWPRRANSLMNDTETRSAPPASGFFGSRQLSMRNRMAIHDCQAGQFVHKTTGLLEVEKDLQDRGD